METEQHSNSHLFTVRVRLEAPEEDHREWRGELRHIPSGEVRYFRGWVALIPLMLDILRRYPPQLTSATGRDFLKSSSASEDLN